MHLFPKQGEDPWRNTQDFFADKKMVREGPIADSALKFSNPISDQPTVIVAEEETAAA